MNSISANRQDKATAQNGATFEHRHFAIIADIISAMPDSGYRADVAIMFADGLAKTNPRFDRSRFMKACNVSI